MTLITEKLGPGLYWGLAAILCLAGAIIGATKGGDYAIFDYGIRTAVRDPGATYAGLDQPIFFLYGPIFMVLAWPLALLPFGLAKTLWIVFQCVAFLTLIGMLHRLYPRSTYRPLLWLWAFVFLTNPVHSNFQLLNIQVPLLASLIGAFLLCETAEPRYHVTAGILVAFAAGVKVFPAFLLVFLFLSQGKSFRKGAVLGVFLTLALPFFIFGMKSGQILFRGFFENLTRVPNVDYASAPAHVMNLHSLTARIGFTLGWPQKYAQVTAKFLTLLIASSYFGVAYLKSRGPLWQDRNYRIGWFALGCALTVFLAPYTFIHYYVFYIPAFFWVLEQIARSTERRYGLLLGLAVVTLLVALTTDFVVGKDNNAQLEYLSIPLYGIILLIAMACFCLIRWPINSAK